MAENRRSAPRGGHGHGPQGHGFQRPKDMRGTFKKLMGYVGKYKGSLVLVAVCLIVSSAGSVRTCQVLPIPALPSTSILIPRRSARRSPSTS